MNQGFRTVWNKVRGAYVPVSEIASAPRQARGSERKARKTAASLAVAAALGIMAASTPAYADWCTNIGGTMANGVCTIQSSTKPGTPSGSEDEEDLIQTTTQNFNSGVSVPDGYTLALVGGGTKYTAPVFAVAVNGNSTLTNAGTGTIRILGGSAESALGLAYIAARTDDGNAKASTGAIVNAGSGSILIQGGSGLRANGLTSMVKEDSARITNSGSGTITIIGGSGEQASGMNQMTSKTGSNAVIENTGTGTIVIQGGAGKNANGIALGAINMDGTTTASITNAAGGTIRFVGGAGGSGLGVGAREGSAITITNAGTMRVEGGNTSTTSAAGVGRFATDAGSTAAITNEAGAAFTVLGSSNDGTSMAVGELADAGATARIDNKGALTISGGSGRNAFGMLTLATGAGSTGEIVTAETGTVVISGGAGANAYGLQSVGDTTATGRLIFAGSGESVIQGGSGEGAYGIGNLGLRNGSGSIENSGAGVLRIQGGAGANAAAIAQMAGQAPSGSITNSGTGEIVFEGGDGGYAITQMAVDQSASDGMSTATIANTNTGTITFRGGKVEAVQLGSGMEGGAAVIRNAAGGTILFEGGAADAMRYGAYYGGTFTLENAGSGTITLTSGEANSWGIGALAYTTGSVGTFTGGDAGSSIVVEAGGMRAVADGAFASNAKGSISSGLGNLTFRGGANSLMPGLAQTAYGMASTTAGSALPEGKIEFKGASGLIEGGAAAPGIFFNSYNDATASITNSTTLAIRGGTGAGADGIYANAQGASATSTRGTGTITNTGSGFTITGGAADAYGIHFNANAEKSSTTTMVTGLIESTSNADWSILGSASGGSGIGINASGGGAKGTIANRGTGTLTLQGALVTGTTWSHGIAGNAYTSGTVLGGNTAEGKILNTGGGTIAFGPAALEVNGGLGASGLIENSAGGTITFAGQDANSWAVTVNANKGTGIIRNPENATMTFSPYAVKWNASGSGSKGSIILEAEAEQTFGANTFYINAADSGVGLIQNASDANWTFQGTKSTGYAMTANAAGGTGTIENAGAGTLSFNSYGLQANANGAGAVGNILLTGTGNIEIMGAYSSGIALEANATGTGAVGVIENRGSGTIVIGDRNTEESSIRSNAAAGGHGSIINSSSGSISIASAQYGNAIATNATGAGSVGLIANDGAGTITLGKHSVTRIADDSGQGTIANRGEGSVVFSTGSIGIVAQGTGSIGVIENTGSGDLYLGPTAKTRAPEPDPDVPWYISTVAYEGGTGIIRNSGTGTTTLATGAISTLATGTGSVGKVVNAGSGTLSLASDVAATFATNGGTAQIINEGDALTLAATSSAWKSGAMVTDASTVELINSGSGTFTLRGGTASNISAITTGATTGTFNLKNTGSGTFAIDGGSQQMAMAITTVAGANATGLIENSGTGTIKIQAMGAQDSNGIYYLADGANANATLRNSATGTITVTGGSVNASLGIRGLVNSAGSAKVENTGGGTINVVGGSGPNAAGINVLNGAVTNTTGTMNFLASPTSWAVKFMTLNSISGSITNSATMNFTGSTAGTAASYALSSADGTGSITNNGTMTISGGIDTLAIALNNTGTLSISKLATGSITANGIRTASSGTITNSGTLYLTAGGIGTLGTFTNKATGTVNAEAAAIFQSGATTSKQVDVPVTTIDPKHPLGYVEEVTVANYKATQVTTGSWALKSDWATNKVKWEDGGTLIINDIKDGTGSATHIKDAFTAKYGTGTTLSFTGTGGSDDAGETISSKPDFTLTHVNAMISAKTLTDGRMVSSETLTLGANKAFTMGASGTDLTINTGFQGIKGGKSISVDGKTLWLLGGIAKTGVTVDENASATTTTAEAPITLTNSAELSLGLAGYRTTEGILGDISADKSSVVNVQKGIFRTGHVSGEGHLKIGEDAALTTSSAEVAHVTNEGVWKATGKVTLVNIKDPAIGDGSTSYQSIIENREGAKMIFGEVENLSGTIVNLSTINAGSITVGASGILINGEAGVVTTTDLTSYGAIANQGTINVNGTATMAFSEGAMTGTWRVARFRTAETHTDDANRISGKTYSEELQLAEGAVHVLKGGVLAGKELKDGRVGSRIRVDEGGVFAFSHDERSLSEALEGYQGEKAGKAILALNTDLAFDKGGRLTVGSVAKETGTVNLGSNALMLVGTADLSGKALLSGEAGQALHAEKGATIALTRDVVWGNHYLMKDFDEASSKEILEVGVYDADGNKLPIRMNAYGVYVTNGSDNILDLAPGFGFEGGMNAVLDGRQDMSSAFADVSFLSTALGGGRKGAKITADLETLPAQAGVFAETFRFADETRSAVNARSSAHRASGSNEAGGFWAAGLIGMAEAGDMDASVASKTGYEADSTGFVFGAEGYGSDWTLGAAFAAQKSDIDAKHTDTSNDAESYAFSLYASKALPAGALISANIGYLWGTNELKQTNNGSRIAGDADTQALTAGIRIERPIVFGAEGSFSAAPYAGLDYTWMKAKGFEGFINRQKAFSWQDADAVLLAVPVGVRLDGKLGAVHQGALQGTLDLSVVPQFGDRRIEQSVRAVNLGTTDRYSVDAADKLLGNLKAGLSWEGASSSFELSYGASVGTVRDLSHSFSAEATFRF